jgi:hypothetical protein
MACPRSRCYGNASSRLLALPWLNDTGVVGGDDGLDPVANAELGQEIRDVRLHGGLAFTVGATKVGTALRESSVDPLSFRYQAGDVELGEGRDQLPDA